MIVHLYCFTYGYLMPGLLMKQQTAFASCYPIVPCRNNVMIISRIIYPVMFNQSKSMLDPSVYICLPSLTSSITISTYSANGPGTEGRHQQWDVPAPSFTFILRSYIQSIPCHLITMVIYSTNLFYKCVPCLMPETMQIISCPKYERS